MGQTVRLTGVTLCPRQRRRVRKIIEDHVGWMVGVSVTEAERSDNMGRATRELVEYLGRITVRAEKEGNDGAI